MSEIPYLPHLCRYEVPVVSFITVRGTFIQTIPYVIRRYFKHLVKSNTVKKNWPLEPGPAQSDGSGSIQIPRLRNLSTS